MPWAALGARMRCGGPRAVRPGPGIRGRGERCGAAGTGAGNRSTADAGRSREMRVRGVPAPRLAGGYLAVACEPYRSNRLATAICC
jgi:hypothetical protein